MRKVCYNRPPKGSDIMTKEQKALIDGLSLENLQTIASIFKDESKEALEYFNERLNKLTMDHECLKMALELSKEVPISYAPTLGINFERKAWKDCTVYDYYHMSEEEKPNICLFGPAKISNLNCAVHFLLRHLQNKVKICRESNLEISSGIEILDQDLEAKKKLVAEQYDAIYKGITDSLADNIDIEYVFTFRKTAPAIASLLLSSRQSNLIEIFARYSDLEELKSKNGKCYRKFIRR